MKPDNRWLAIKHAGTLEGGGNLANFQPEVKLNGYL